MYHQVGVSACLIEDDRRRREWNSHTPEVENLNESFGIPTINRLSTTVEELHNVAENNNGEGLYLKRSY